MLAEDESEPHVTPSPASPGQAPTPFGIPLAWYAIGAMAYLLFRASDQLPKSLVSPSAHNGRITVRRSRFRFRCDRCHNGREAYAANFHSSYVLDTGVPWRNLCAQCWCWLDPKTQQDYTEVRG